MREHRERCGACSELLKEHVAFETDLRLAFAVPVRTGFEERLVETIRIQSPASPRNPAGRRRFIAAAATVAGGAIGIGLLTWLDRDDPLALSCIEFVMKEEAKSIMMGALPRAEAARVLATSLPIEQLERIGQVKHIGPCPFNGAIAYHAVLAVPQGKVTLLIMPDFRLPTRKRAVHEGLYASVVPLPRGSVGVIGASAAVVDSVAGALRS
jgi:hypothetical protein